MPGYRKRLLKRVVVTKKLLFNKTNIFISPWFLNLENALILDNQGRSRHEVTGKSAQSSHESEKHKKFHDAVSGFHLAWYFTVLFDWTYVGHSIRNFVRLTITCVLWSKRSRMQKTYLKLFKHFQWSVCNVALDLLMTLLVAMSKKLMKYLSSLTTSQPFIESIGKDIFRTSCNFATPPFLIVRQSYIFLVYLGDEWV